MTIGALVRGFMEKLEWFDTRFPRIPVNAQVRKWKLDYTEVISLN